jgi:hypothetical protein
MRTRIWKILRTVVFVWGAFSLLGAIAVGALLVYQFGPGNRDKEDSASIRDVHFVLNLCGLGDQRIEKVLHSHISSRSFIGDYLDAYAIKISRVEISELAATLDNSRRRWYRGDSLPKVVDDAVALVNGSQHELPWFPPETELRSSEFYVYPFGCKT